MAQTYNTNSTTAEYGNNNAAVGQLQTYLNSKGAKLTVDNKYGDLTKAAVAQYGTPNSGTITSDSLKGGDSLTLQNENINNSTSNLSVAPVMPDITGDNIKTEGTKYVSDALKYLSGESKSQYEANQEFDTINKKANYKALELESKQIDQNYLDEQKRIKETNPGGTFGGALSQKLNDLSYKYTSLKNNKNIELALAQNNYNSAVEMANAKVKAEYQPIKDNIDNLIKFQEFNATNNAMTDKEKMLLAQKIDQENAKYETGLELGTYREKAKIDAAAMASGDMTYTPVAPTTYTTKPTDSGGLYQIAKDNGLDFEALKAANPQLGADFAYKPGTIINLPSAYNPSPTNGSILEATGLSSVMMNYMTQGTSALTRMNEATRKQVMNSADAWAKAHGTDTATLQSQFKANNETLQKNIERANNVNIAEQELLGTIDNLNTASKEKELGKLKASNIAKLWTAEQYNDPVAVKYATHLNQLRTEYAYYNAVYSGNGSTTIQDFEEAERTIKNGLSSYGLKGFEEAIKASTIKNEQILQGSIDRSAKAVWNLFGVANKYKSNTPVKETVNTNTTLDDVYSTITGGINTATGLLNAMTTTN